MTKSYPNLTDSKNNNTSYDLTQSIRRPSENLFQVMGHHQPTTSNVSSNASSYDSIRQKRPNSEDSSVSRNTELFSNVDSSSPSMISIESFDKDIKSYSTSQLNKSHQQQHYMTPSQRYRLRKNQTEVSLRNIIKNDINKNTWENDHIDNINEEFLWNIPTTTTYLNTLNSNDKLPSVTQIPGVSSNYHNDDQYMTNMCNSLSSTYLNETTKQSHLKLTNRLNSTDLLPIELKQLDKLGMEDMKCISREKIGMMSPGRPTWLPPKSPTEIRKHKKEINKQMDDICHDELIRHQWLENYKINLRENYTLLNENWSNDKFLNKIVKEIPLPIELKYKIYYHYFENIDNIESYESLIKKFSNLQFPPDKSLEITKLIQDNYLKGIFTNDKISSTITNLLKLRSISRQGICRGDDVIIYHLLNKQVFSLSQIFTMLQLIQYKIMNCHDLYEKLSIRQKKKYENKDDDTKFNNWWNVMERIDNSDLFLWIIDMIIISADWLKVMISLPILITRDYHYGWETLKTLHDVKKYRVLFPGDDSTDLLYKNHHFMLKLISLSKSI